jgi:hypothetical protein
MDRHGMTLETGITMFPHVFAWDAGGTEDIQADVIVERFYVPSFAQMDRLLDTCHFALIVVRKGKVEESLVCKGFDDLVRQLIVGVHGGHELAYGEHWSSALEEQEGDSDDRS